MNPESGNAAPTRARRSVVFDLDGTLVDSAPGVLAAFAQAFESRGLQPVVPLDRAIVGPPLRRTLALLAGSEDAALLDDLAARFRAAYDGELCATAEPYPGIPEALRRLAAAGAGLYVATNKRDLPTRRLVEALGWGSLFRGIRCSDTDGASAAPDKRRTLAMLVREHGIVAESALMVGDSIDDAEAAAHSALAFVGVTWGYGSVALAARYPDVRRVRDPAELD
jgi:phosphoglycolate phosphatase